MSSRKVFLFANSSAVGCTLPVASVTLETSVCSPGVAPFQRQVNSFHEYFPLVDGSIVAGCHGPSADATKGREQDVLLGLEPGRLVVRSRDSGAVLKTLPYKSIVAATYARDKRPRPSDDTSLASVPDNFGGSGFFLGSAKHWLTLQTKSEFLILRLEDKNMRPITTAIESRTGLKTLRVEEAKK